MNWMPSQGAPSSIWTHISQKSIKIISFPVVYAFVVALLVGLVVYLQTICGDI